MKVLKTIVELRSWRESLRGSVGFAPTMGNLHQGHLACLETARRGTDHSVVSIFVNPTQFAPTDDFAKYPRTLEQDLDLLMAAGCDAVFAPDIQEMYPDGASTKVIAGSMANGLEGDFRPGHFDGVATICLKLFQLVQPSVVGMGCKDLQQLRVIQQMVRDFNLPVEIAAVPTCREESGLALSSRNRYLSDGDKVQALQLYQGLKETLRLFKNGTDVTIAETKTTASLTENGWNVDYIAIRDALTLSPITAATIDVAVLGAARIGGVRLIDNIVEPRN